jgi:accessory gene regulator protein AgrB
VLGIEVLIQTFYLVRHKATYAEAFYSLKRSYQSKTGGLKELSRGLILVSVLMEAVMPYLREKMEQNERSLLLKIFVRVMSVVKFAY